MRDNTTEEVIELVETLNQEVFNIPGVDENFGSPFTVETNGIYQAILFLDINIWDSETDERRWLTDDELENLEPFVRKQVNKLIKTISSIKL